MADHIITADDDSVAADDLQDFASRSGWGGVEPMTQQRVRFRDTMREAVVQKRGAFYFAVSFDSDGRPHGVGPSASRIKAAREAVDKSRKVATA